MNASAPGRVAARGRARRVVLSALAAMLDAATPKCPLCAAAMLCALGVGSPINSTWLQPLAAALLLLGASIWNAATRRRAGCEARCGHESCGVVLGRRGVAGSDAGI
jgi:hypothetical protein